MARVLARLSKNAALTRTVEGCADEEESLAVDEDEDECKGQTDSDSGEAIHSTNGEESGSSGLSLSVIMSTVGLPRVSTASVLSKDSTNEKGDVEQVPGDDSAQEPLHKEDTDAEVQELLDASVEVEMLIKDALEQLVSQFLRSDVYDWLESQRLVCLLRDL